MNWAVVIIIGLLVLGLLVFLVTRNLKDEKEFEKQMNNNFRKSRDAEGESDTGIN